MRFNHTCLTNISERGRHCALCAVALALLFVAAAAPPASATLFDGFTEPHRTINVASAEVGVILKIDVREGDVVQKGQVLVTLDNDVHRAMVAIAAEQMNAKGRLDAAQAELELRKSRLEKLELLQAKGHARPEEVDRARTDATMAESQLLAAREDLLVRKLEYDKANLQLERRTVRAPADGLITKTLKQEGEFVAPNDPVLFTLVQLNPLVATFSVPSPQTAGMRVEQKVIVTMAGGDVRAPGVIDFISPVTDAESGTVRIKVRIDNTKRTYRSGERCTLEIPAAKPFAP